MTTYTVIVQFIDGEKLLIEGVNSFVKYENVEVYGIEKNGYRMFFNETEVKYMARETDIKNSLKD